jgi:hypothetical protein
LSQQGSVLDHRESCGTACDIFGRPCEPVAPANRVQQHPATYAAGWICGAAEDYDRESRVDLAPLSAFVSQTQPELCEALDLGTDGPTRRKFLARLQGEINNRSTASRLALADHRPRSPFADCFVPSRTLRRLP